MIIFTDTSSLKYLWIAEGFGKQIRFPNIIRRRNSLPPRIEILRGDPAKCSAILWGVQKQLDELHIALVGQLEEE